MLSPAAVSQRNVSAADPLASTWQAAVRVSASFKTVSAIMEDPPAGIPGCCVDHLADLVVAKAVGNPSSSFSLITGLMQQEALQGFIQGGEPVLRCKLGDLTELLKGEVLTEDRSCNQEVASGGRKLGQATLNHLAHLRGENVAYLSDIEDRRLRLKHPAAFRDQAGHQDATFE